MDGFNQMRDFTLSLITEAPKEAARLRTENAALRAELARIKSEAPQVVDRRDGVLLFQTSNSRMPKEGQV